MKLGTTVRYATLAGLAMAHAALAGSFSVTPVRVELTEARRTAVLTLHNPEDSPLTLQVALVDWAQADGLDHYADTHDLLATPPVFTIPAKSEQIVRVALRRDLDPARELPYRIFFEQVPESAPRDFNGLNIALRIGVPVFLLPHATTHADLTWEAHYLADGRLQILANNRGSAHVQVTDFDLRLGSGASTLHVADVKYVLPGSQMSWTVTPPAGTDPASMAHLHGFSDRGELTADIAVSPRP